MAHFRAVNFPLCLYCAGRVLARRSSSLSKLPWRKEAEQIVGYPTSFLNLRYLLSDEISNVVGHLRKLVGTRHPLLKTARRLLDDEGGFQSRGITVLLMSKALTNASLQDATSISTNPSGILPAQRHLSEITELIYTAELIHDNIVNVHHRESEKATPDDTEPLLAEQLKELSDGNKLTVLLGDYLLATASSGLGKLYNVEVTRMMSQALSDMKVAACLRISWQVAPQDDLFGMSESLFTGQSGHITSPPEGADSVGRAPVPLLNWMRWLGLAHGSLLSHGCSGTAALAGASEEMQHSAQRFGWHLAMADGLHSELNTVLSSFGSPMAVGFLQSLCQDERVFEEAKSEAARAQQYHAQAAVESLSGFPPSDACNALLRMAKELT